MGEYGIDEGDLLFMADGDDAALDELVNLKESLRTAKGFGDDIEIHKFIAKGTAGWVFLTERKATKKRMAMKLIRLTQARTGVKEWFISRRMREAGADKGIVLTYEDVHILDRDNAPDVVQKELQNAGPVRYYMALFQDLMPWGTIEDRALSGELCLEVMFKSLLDVLDTLAAMHAAKVQHRDVKPENIMLQMTKDNDFVCAKLCDLGSATCGAGETGEDDDYRRWGVTLFAAATGEGWTNNRLMHEKHETLVERLKAAVSGCGNQALEKLPALLDDVLQKNVALKAARKRLADLASAAT